MIPTAKVIADSINNHGVRLTTMEVKFHRFILPEFNTHRAFSRNFSSSRAIPTQKLIEQVRDNPVTPLHWGQNQPGMQADKEIADALQAKDLWLTAAKNAAETAQRMSLIGIHKQVVNRLLEPFLPVTGIVSSTDYDNFFALRDHPAAQPEMQALARAMREALDISTPVKRIDGWHLPYVNEEERLQYNLYVLARISAARCCRVSYLKHNGEPASVEEDLALCERLITANPMHASPFEHQAEPDHSDSTALCGNFFGWWQFRHILEMEKLK